MISADSLPEPVAKLWALAHRFQKFLVVGVLGLATNQAFLWLLHERSGLTVAAASPIAILISMVVTFFLNEKWTWHDRGGARWLSRAGSYVPINLGGLGINWGVLTFLHDQFGMHYLLANIIGAGIAAIWNFGLNNAITWRK